MIDKCNSRKKKVLVLLYAYFPYENANTNVFLPILEKLVQSDYGVDILTCDLKHHSNKYEFKNRIGIYRYHTGIIKKVIYFVANRLQKHNLQLTKLAKKRCQNYNIETPNKLFVSLYYWFMTSGNLSRTLRKIVKDNLYSYIIPVSAPPEMQLPVLNLYINGFLSHKDTKYIPYFMDPWASYIGAKSHYKEYMVLENLVYDNADAIIVTPEMYYKNNMINPLQQYLSKTWPLELCCLKRIVDDGEIEYFDKSKINCLFCGSLQDLSVRDPTFLFKIIENIDNDSIVFHLVVNYFSEDCKRIYLRHIKDNNNCILYERLPLSTCHSMMAQSDVCINIGNSCDNQLPSKVFDYMGAGVPIINLHNIEDDTTKILLRNYPLKLNLNETSVDMDISLGKFELFCKNMKGKRVEYGILERIYHNYTGDTVSSKFIEILRNVS